jgi:Protein of unknown function (DUF2817)
MSVDAVFAQSYAEARGKFLAAADAAGLDVHSHAHPLRGRDGEALAMDVARLGAADAPALLLLSSACHGVEGYCGSGVQNALLADPDFHAQAAAAGVAVLYVHALNPYGFSWLRRVTHENVDLNRNFHDFSEPLPANPGYDAVAHWLLPAQWPPTTEVMAAIDAYIEQHGARAWQAAVTSGQSGHPQGLFYSGVNPTWSHTTLRQVLRERGRRCRRMAWIDLHTGLGPSGHGERIFAGPDDPVGVARARRWWGEITSVYDGSSSSAPLNGLMWNAARQECPQAEHTGIALEYGTLPLPAMIDALRAEHWLENHPETGAAQREAIKRQFRDAFYTDTADWKQQILVQGLQAARQAVAGLAA